MAQMIRGTELDPRDRQRVLNTYVHRMTTEARQRWPEASQRMLRGGYRMPERTDAEWLANTFFLVRKRDGRLDERARYCETHHGALPQ